MQVVLLEDVKALGKRGRIVNVDDGYAKNFILSKKLGVEANSENLNDLKLRKASDDRIAVGQLAVVRELGARPDESSVTLTVKAGRGGRVLRSVPPKETGKAIGNQLGIDIDKKKIMLSDSIKSIGNFEVSVKLHKEVTTRLAVEAVEA